MFPSAIRAYTSRSSKTGFLSHFPVLDILVGSRCCSGCVWNCSPGSRWWWMLQILGSQCCKTLAHQHRTYYLARSEEEDCSGLLRLGRYVSNLNSGKNDDFSFLSWILKKTNNCLQKKPYWFFRGDCNVYKMWMKVNFQTMILLVVCFISLPGLNHRFSNLLSESVRLTGI